MFRKALVNSRPKFKSTVDSMWIWGITTDSDTKEGSSNYHLIHRFGLRIFIQHLFCCFVLEPLVKIFRSEPRVLINKIFEFYSAETEAQSAVRLLYAALDLSDKFRCFCFGEDSG